MASDNSRKRSRSYDINAPPELVKLAEGPSHPNKLSKEVKTRLKKFTRGPSVAFKGLTDKKLKGDLKLREELFQEAAVSAAKTEQWLLPSEQGYLEAEGLERTSNFKQEDILANVGLSTGKTVFDLKLTDLGPYKIDFTRNGRFLLLGGEKGHLALLDWKRHKLVTEIQVKEKVRDVQFLHSEAFFAAAQKKYVYIYDKRGLEIHCMKEHLGVQNLAFLPHHFLLASVNKNGLLQYVDTSTGQIVSRIRTKLGSSRGLALNPQNAILHLGHSNGTVTLWSPTALNPLVSMLCHRGPLTGVSVDATGRYMVTTGLDSQLKVWDIRKFQEVHSYFTPSPAGSVALSQTGLLAVGCGSGVQIWRDGVAVKQKAPYLTHRLSGGSGIAEVGFCPYEDVLGVGHEMGFSSLVVPGAGEPNFDSFVANPFQTKRQQREGEVHALLDKLQPEMIVLDPQVVGTVKKEPKSVQREAGRLASAANRKAGKAGNDEAEDGDEEGDEGRKARQKKMKKKQKGKNKASKIFKKKQSNIIEAKKPSIREETQIGALKAKKIPVKKQTVFGAALGRFER